MKAFLPLTIPLIAVLLLTAACSEEQPRGRTEIKAENIAEEDTNLVVRAVDTFRQVCPKLFAKYWGDVGTARLSIVGKAVGGGQAGHDPVQDALARYGWPRAFLLTVEIIAEPQAVTPDMRTEGGAARYVLGGGETPGIYADSRLARLMCEYNADTAFVSVPELNFLRALGPSP